MILAVLAGIPILRLSYATTWLPGIPTGGRLIFAAVLLGTVLSVIAVHELGHLAGGRLVGFRFRLLAIGPFLAHRSDGRIRIGLNRNLHHYPGVAGSSPDDPTGMHWRMAVVLAAGPIASLVAGATGLALMLFDVPDQITRTFFAEFTVSRGLALFAAGSIGVGIITLLPGGTRARPTDGSRMLELLRPGPEADRAAAILSLSSLSLAGNPPETWPEHLLASATGPADGSHTELRALLLAHTAAVARGDHVLAGRLIERALGIQDAPASMREEAIERAAQKVGNAGTGGGRGSTVHHPRGEDPGPAREEYR